MPHERSHDLFLSGECFPPPFGIRMGRPLWVIETRSPRIDGDCRSRKLHESRNARSSQSRTMRIEIGESDLRRLDQWSQGARENRAWVPLFIRSLQTRLSGTSSACGGIQPLLDCSGRRAPRFGGAAAQHRYRDDPARLRRLDRSRLGSGSDD